MHTLKNPVYICAPKRSAIGSYGGCLSTLPTPRLGAQVVKAVVETSTAAPETIDELIMGCVLQAGMGQAPARQVVIHAGLPEAVQAMTINKVCSSGLKAVMLAANNIELGQSSAVLAGGMESMSQAPYLLPALRNGARLGHAQALDSIISDALWDPYADQHMGSCGELCAREHSISREAQDTYALQSYSRANEAIAKGSFVEEIAPVEVKVRREQKQFLVDEEPGKLKPEKVPTLRPVFEKDGTVTAANASSLSDGAAAMLICSEAYVKTHGLTPIAKIVAQGWHAQAPEWFTTAPAKAIENLLKSAGKDIGQVDLFEINEAFSVVALACQKLLGIDSEKLNVHGGAVAMGHPVGATGARILVTLLHALKQRNLKTGVASLCNGGGEATAVLVEMV
ncbi:thiolase family protein [Oligoflexia bacterium]|nr:thiolase family protein [Oligoflexia bacterium]